VPLTSVVMFAGASPFGFALLTKWLIGRRAGCRHRETPPRRKLGVAHQRKCSRALLGVGAVGEQQQVLELYGLFAQRRVAGLQRHVDVDAAAAHADGPHGLGHRRFVFDFAERDGPLVGDVADRNVSDTRNAALVGHLVQQLGSAGPHPSAAASGQDDVRRERDHTIDGSAERVRDVRFALIDSGWREPMVLPEAQM